MDNEALLKKAKEYVVQEQDPFFRRQVETLIESGDFNELNDRFYTDLEFGTGGLRGVIGGGYNRMNPFVVRRATQGLANYIKKAVPIDKASMVIAYDSRNFSDVFALEAACTLCGNGIRTYLFTSLRSTPELSFAVRQLRASSGIVVTASHNPPEYNGYKVYWNDGSQVTPPHDTGIINEVLSVGSIVIMEQQKALDTGMLVMIDTEVDEPFIRMVKNCSLRPGLVREMGKTLKVVYTPLHGTGAMPVETALRDMGITTTSVKEQREPDGNFPTVKFPNPEEASAMQLALQLGELEQADVVMGTDPDADRLGIAAPDNGKLRLMTGNQLGALLADYIFSSRKEMGKMPSRPAFIKTIVTTELQRKVAESYGALCYDTLTGFKYIGEKIREFEAEPNGPQYICGGEESYGFLINTDVRDKDAVSAATMTAEMTLYHRTQGRSLWDQLRVLWEKFGYYEETQVSKTFKGESGMKAMKELMDNLRSNPPKSFGGHEVARVKDVKNGTTLYVNEGKTVKDINLPSSNVLQFFMVDGSIVTARPSGTEPKIKFYASCCSNPEQPLDSGIALVKTKIETIKSELNNLS